MVKMRPKKAIPEIRTAYWKKLAATGTELTKKNAIAKERFSQELQTRLNISKMVDVNGGAVNLLRPCKTQGVASLTQEETAGWHCLEFNLA